MKEISMELDGIWEDIRKKYFHEVKERVLKLLLARGFEIVKTVNRTTDEFYEIWYWLKKGNKHYHLMITEEYDFHPELKERDPEFLRDIFEEGDEE